MTSAGFHGRVMLRSSAATLFPAVMTIGLPHKINWGIRVVDMGYGLGETWFVAVNNLDDLIN